MITVEMVEKLRNYGNISYEEAKNALEQSNENILDAVILLERQGKIRSSGNDAGSVNTTTGNKHQNIEYHIESCGDTLGTHMKKFFKWCKKLIHKGNTNMLDITRNGSTIISIPITVFVIFLMFAFWLVVPLIIISLFLDCRYKFRGPNLGRDDINIAADTVADAASNIKNSVKDAMNDAQ